MQHVEQYKNKEAFVCLEELDKHRLITYLAPIVYMDDTDEYAKRFDNFMYGMMIAQIEAMPHFKRSKKQLMNICVHLEKRATIPQIKAKLELINTIGTEEFWQGSDILNFEKVRVELRELVKFIIDDSQGKTIYTNLKDEVTSINQGEVLLPAYDFEAYRLKVNRYIEEHKDHIAIHKLRNNIPLTAKDYKDLERILTSELGTVEDYKREFKDTPFGLLVRRIAKMEYKQQQRCFRNLSTTSP